MSKAVGKLSDRQRRIMDFIRDFQRERGYPPTVREIGNAADISSTSVVDYNIKALLRLGLLRRDAEVSRGLGLVDATPVVDAVDVPVMGNIAAGEPIEALSVEDDKVTIARDMAGDGAYALRVRGKSMIEDLIDDGDLVIVQPRETADNGEIVVALITDSPTGEWRATLKRFYRERDRIRLQPANATMEPIIVRPDHVRVQGRVAAVVRRLN